MEDDKYMEFLEEESKDVNKMSMWKKVLIGFTGVVVTFMIVIYVAIDFIARDIDENWNEAETQSTFEYEKDPISLQEEEQASKENTNERDSAWEQQYNRDTVITEEGETPDEDITLKASPYASERCGFVVGEVHTFTSGTTCTYQGQDIWIEANGRTWKAVANNEGGITINIYTTSPYLSEKAGYLVGMTCDFGDLGDLTYQGQDIWVNSSGLKYKAYKSDNGALYVDVVRTYDNLYSSYTFAGPSETPISEREGYVVGDVIKYKHDFVGYGYTRTYQGNDVWLREFESGGSKWEVAAYNSNGELDWVEKLD